MGVCAFSARLAVMIHDNIGIVVAAQSDPRAAELHKWQAMTLNSHSNTVAHLKHEQQSQ